MAVSIAVLSLSLIMYSIYSASAAEAERALEAEGICLEVSSFVGSFSSLGQGAVAHYAISRPYSKSNFTVFMVGDRSLVKVDYENAGERVGVGCRFPSTHVTDGTGASTFSLSRNFTLVNTEGGVVVVQ
ncbi:Uncharacterised protein [uncultured archaeon]|nr:Uncharacterised protein [uncultured archaeon]